MTTVTESDIKELKDLINQRFDLINQQFELINQRFELVNQRFDELKTDGIKMSEQIKSLEIGQGEIKGRLTSLESSSQKIPDLAEKVGELKNWKQIGLTLIGAIFGGLITYLVKTPHP